MASLLDFIKNKMAHCPLIFLDADLHYLREMREAELRGNLKLFLNANATKKEELKCFKQAHCNIVHSDVERNLVERELVLHNVIELPYAVDVRLSAVGFDERKDILFLGGYEHMPNTDAARYFVSEIWVRVRTQLHEGARLFLVGSKPGADVYALECSDVVVTGQVKHLDEYFDNARVFVAPLRYGAGIKGKMVTAMAHGVPIVATSVASEGLQLQQEEHYMLANDADSFANQIVRLYHDKGIWEHIQHAGYEFASNFAAKKVFNKVISEAISIARKNWIAECDLSEKVV